jgi:hypothetical protein
MHLARSPARPVEPAATTMHAFRRNTPHLNDHFSHQ